MWELEQVSNWGPLVEQTNSKPTELPGLLVAIATRVHAKYDPIIPQQVYGCIESLQVS